MWVSGWNRASVGVRGCIHLHWRMWVSALTWVCMCETTGVATRVVCVHSGAWSCLYTGVCSFSPAWKQIQRKTLLCTHTHSHTHLPNDLLSWVPRTPRLGRHFGTTLESDAILGGPRVSFIIPAQEEHSLNTDHDYHDHFSTNLQIKKQVQWPAQGRP